MPSSARASLNMLTDLSGSFAVAGGCFETRRLVAGDSAEYRSSNSPWRRLASVDDEQCDDARFIRRTPKSARAIELQWLSRNRFPIPLWAAQFRAAGFRPVWQDCDDHPLDSADRAAAFWVAAQTASPRGVTAFGLAKLRPIAAAGRDGCRRIVSFSQSAGFARRRLVRAWQRRTDLCTGSYLGEVRGSRWQSRRVDRGGRNSTETPRSAAASR